MVADLGCCTVGGIVPPVVGALSLLMYNLDYKIRTHVESDNFYVS